jgi:hypothetical protein
MKQTARKIKKHKNKTVKTKKGRLRVFTEEEYNSNDGMNTSIWGPCFWLVLHTMSFNYPVNPSEEDKLNYKNLILNLQNVLPCKYCRINLKKNMTLLPLTQNSMKNRESFSRYVYELHEVVNKMLGKKSKLTYETVRERFEHFRGRQGAENNNKEKGCADSLYGKKSKCIIKIIPKETKCDTLQINKKCLKKLK